MAYPKTFRNFNAFIAGISYFGKVMDAKMPMLDLDTADHRGAGMDGPIAIDMGMKGMTAEVSFSEWVPGLITLFGTRERVVFRPGAMGEVDFSAVSTIVTVGGRWSKKEIDGLKPGKEALLKLTCSVDYVRMEQDNVELYEIDIENGKRVIGGVDQLADLRAAMGL